MIINSTIIYYYLSAFIFLILFDQSSYASIDNKVESNKTKPTRDHAWEMYAIKTKGCIIPGFEPMNKDVEPYYNPPTEPVACLGGTNPMFLYNGTHITIQKQNFYYYNITESNLIDCCYASFFRSYEIPDRLQNEEVDQRVKYSRCKSFRDTIKVKHEFVKVFCSYKQNNITYSNEQYFLHALKKPVSPKQQSFSQNRHNVIIMGLDSVSRLNFHRTMPKTLKFLKDKGAVELFGYNKVGGNTFPNLIPMLLGIAESELRITCLPNSRVPFDNCPFMWSWFKEIGYMTAIGEDNSNLGTFNYEKTGFYGEPVDYYLHPFINIAETVTGNAVYQNTAMCYGDRKAYKILLDYIQSLTTLLASEKLFGFFWEVSMTHDSFLFPMLIDNDYEKFFKQLDSSGYLNDTILFFVSDHGIHYGDFRLTEQGRIEDKLPFVYILTPPSFQNKYKLAFNNLQSNSRRLTTPFDVHATLEDLVTLDINDEAILYKSTKPYAHKRRISLFLPIPTNRTCETARIADHWCTCHTEIKYKNNSEEAISSSKFLVRHINSLLDDYHKCAKLVLDEVLGISQLKKIGDNEQTHRVFTVVIRTNPGGGIFESTVRQTGRLSDKSWKITGTISRLNKYRGQSNCVKDFHIELYCYCKHPE